MSRASNTHEVESRLLCLELLTHEVESRLLCLELLRHMRLKVGCYV